MVIEDVIEYNKVNKYQREHTHDMTDREKVQIAIRQIKRRELLELKQEIIKFVKKLYRKVVK